MRDIHNCTVDKPEWRLGRNVRTRGRGVEKSPLALRALLATAVLVAVAAHAAPLSADGARRIGIAREHTGVMQPLEVVTVVGAPAGTLVVRDGTGREYVRRSAAPGMQFVVGGSLGRHTVQVLDERGQAADETSFQVDAQTLVEEDTGDFQALFDMAKSTASVDRPLRESGAPAGGLNPVSWRGRAYRLFAIWALDQAETSKGMAFFSPYMRDGVSLFRDAQRSDGLIWSFVIPDDERQGYWDTAYGPLGYMSRDGGALCARQPAENHVEYQFVNMLYHAWKATGDDAFMQGSLDAAVRALDYSVRDPVRFSKRFGLLKRPHTIDSWDFQADDAYTVCDTLNPTMTINPERTKFGIFFGDNTGYMQACDRLAELLERAGRADDAARFRARRAELTERLTRVSWNGRFFRHFVEEDPSVRRDLGVDEAIQVAQGNAYSLNRGITQAQAAAILRTYAQLRNELPKGSPGEWYAIYPPFTRGFGDHGATWQYMNGGVSGHAAGELARGAFAHGFERYGASVLTRAANLAKRTDRVIHFAYTGASAEPSPAPRFTTISLAHVANMDVAAPSPARAWMDEEPGNDLARLPHGRLNAGGAPFELLDPAANEHRVVLAVATRPGYPTRAEVPIDGRTAGALHMLHTLHRGREAGKGPVTDHEIAAGVTIRYTDGTERGTYLKRAEHVSGWWYPDLERPRAGVAWRGPNAKTGDVGLTWAVIPNPEPKKPIASVVISASLEGSVYALAGLTLADRMPHEPPSPISYGGPDNWAGATMMLALVEGLGGVIDTDRAYARVEVAPRWAATGARRARVVARYQASRGYVAYALQHERAASTLTLQLTGCAESFRARVLLPAGTALRDMQLDGRGVVPEVRRLESSRYAELDVPHGVHELRVRYTQDVRTPPAR